MECCIMEAEGCLIKDLVSPRQSCSIACQKRYASLSYACYEKYSIGWQWVQMRKSCDPQGVVTFTPPTTLEPQQPVAVGVSSATPVLRRGLLFLLPLWALVSR